VRTRVLAVRYTLERSLLLREQDDSTARFAARLVSPASFFALSLDLQREVLRAVPSFLHVLSTKDAVAVLGGLLPAVVSAGAGTGGVEAEAMDAFEVALSGRQRGGALRAELIDAIGASVLGGSALPLLAAISLDEGDKSHQMLRTYSRLVQALAERHVPLAEFVRGVWTALFGARGEKGEEEVDDGGAVFALEEKEADATTTTKKKKKEKATDPESRVLLRARWSVVVCELVCEGKLVPVVGALRHVRNACVGARAELCGTSTRDAARREVVGALLRATMMMSPAQRLQWMGEVLDELRVASHEAKATLELCAQLAAAWVGLPARTWPLDCASVTLAPLLLAVRGGNAAEREGGAFDAADDQVFVDRLETVATLAPSLRGVVYSVLAAMRKSRAVSGEAMWAHVVESVLGK
jgi:hypothetical protein